MAADSGDEILAEEEEKTEPAGKPGHAGTLTGAAIGFGIGVVFAFGGFTAGFVATVCMLAGAVIGYVIVQGLVVVLASSPSRCSSAPTWASSVLPGSSSRPRTPSPPWPKTGT
jgi:hypothetical protein